MIFGKRTARCELGAFSGQQCPACQKSHSFRLACLKRYIVAFFLNLIPFSVKYETVCENCGDTKPLNSQDARSIKKENFAGSDKRLFAADAAKVLVLLILLAVAVALPLSLARPKATPEILKNLVTEDGAYNILNDQGELLGVIEITAGEKRLSLYNEISVLTGEPGAGQGFSRHEYYQETVGSEGETILARTASSAGILKDKHGTPVREYYYLKFADTLGYARGVEDLSAISYTPSKVVYPFIDYSDASDEPEQSKVVLYFPAGKKIETAFDGEKKLIRLLLSDYQNGRIMATTRYNVDADAIAQAQQFGLSPQSTADEVLLFIEQHGQSYLTAVFSYYKNTKVMTSIDMRMTGVSGEEQTYAQTFDITEKDGFYILSELAQG